MATEVRTVLMTAPDPETATALGRRLVEERLAACVNLVPGVTSVYWWEGGVQEDQEVLMVLKTRVSMVSALVQRAVELHPYEVPEVLVLPVESGSERYLEWVRQECRAPSEV